MVRLKCPRCGTLVTGEPGAAVVCPQCGFQATVPGAAAAPPRRMADEPPRNIAPPSLAPAPSEVPATKSLGVWAYLLAILSIGTFFMAPYVFPFLLGLGGMGAGFLAYARDRRDRRALIAAILGLVGLLFAAIFLLEQ